MSRALSRDLRLRVMAAVAEGLSHRAAAARFGVSAASVSRWRRRAVVEGDPRPRALGGDRRSGRIEAHSDVILGVLAETPDITIEELRHLLAGRGLDFGYGTIQRFLVRHKMTRKKKTGRASEQDRADVLERRQAWRDSQAALEPARLVFIDETWAKTNMARTHGRAPRGERLHMGQPYSHWKTSTFVAELTLRGMIAPFALDGPINRLAFETYVEKVRGALRNCGLDADCFRRPERSRFDLSPLNLPRRGPRTTGTASMCRPGRASKSDFDRAPPP